MYADYEFYTKQYYGSSISEADFNKLATRASSYLDYYTQNRAKSHSELEAVKLACCAIAEQYQIIEKYKEQSASDSGELQSQSVGSWSKTYRSRDEAAKAATAELSRLAGQYLAGSKLSYRGVKCVSTYGNCI